MTHSWQLMLQSTWPARPDAELLLFVPLLVLLTAMVGIELLRWPAVAALPSLALVVLSQAFVAVSGTVATLVALAYAVVVAGLFVSRARTAVVLTVAVCAVAGRRRHGHRTPDAVLGAAGPGRGGAAAEDGSPLSEVAARMADPDTEVFSYTSDGPGGPLAAGGAGRLRRREVDAEGLLPQARRRARAAERGDRADGGAFRAGHGSAGAGRGCRARPCRRR